MAHILKGSHSFICIPCVHPLLLRWPRNVVPMYNAMCNCVPYMGSPFKRSLCSLGTACHTISWLIYIYLLFVYYILCVWRINYHGLFTFTCCLFTIFYVCGE